jgi:hypothetical protein
VTFRSEDGLRKRDDDSSTGASGQPDKFEKDGESLEELKQRHLEELRQRKEK